jgi:hypothetical protein
MLECLLPCRRLLAQERRELASQMHLHRRLTRRAHITTERARLTLSASAAIIVTVEDIEHLFATRRPEPRHDQSA